MFSHAPKWQRVCVPLGLCKILEPDILRKAGILLQCLGEGIEQRGGPLVVAGVRNIGRSVIGS